MTVHGEALYANLQASSERLAAMLAEHTEGARSAFDNSGSHIVGLIEESHARVREGLNSHTGELHQRFLATAEETLSAIMQHTGDLNDRLSSASQETIAALRNETNELQQRLSVAAYETSNLLSSHREELEAQLYAAGQNTSAVSYTHLDVYKRQTPQQWRRSAMTRNK